MRYLRPLPGAAFIILVVTTIALAACGGDGASDTTGGSEPLGGEITVSSEDGSASLIVPASALPSGVSPEDISVSAVPMSELGVDDEGEGRVAAFALEPDGLQLEEPALLVVTVATPDGYIPSVFHLGAGETAVEGTDEALTFAVDVIPRLRVTYRPALGTSTLEIPIDHFSSISVNGNKEYAYFKITTTGDTAGIDEYVHPTTVVAKTSSELTSGDYPGKDSFTVTYGDYHGWPDWFYVPTDVYTHYKENEGKKGSLSLRFTMVEDSARLSGSTDGTESEVLLPNWKFDDRPPDSPLYDQFMIPSNDYECSDAGEEPVIFNVTVTWQEVVELQRAWDPTWRVIKEGQRWLDVRAFADCTCLVAPPTTTATEQTSPTSTTTTTTTTTMPEALTHPPEEVACPFDPGWSATPVTTIILTRGRGVLVPFGGQSSDWAQARRGDPGMTPLFYEEPPLEALLFMPVDIGFGTYGTLPVCNLTGHSNGVLETESQGNTDLVRVVRGVEDPTDAEVENAFGQTDFPCGMGEHGYTICGGEPFPPGPTLLIDVTLAGQVPIDDPTYLFQYGFVFDRDGDPANDYEASPDYPMDFFSGTDRWYSVTYFPDTGWMLHASDPGSGPVPTAARVIIGDWGMTLVVPTSEIGDLEDASFRVTAFRHLGDFGMQPPHEWNGDTFPAVGEPLIPVIDPNAG